MRYILCLEYLPIFRAGCYLCFVWTRIPRKTILLHGKWLDNFKCLIVSPVWWRAACSCAQLSCLFWSLGRNNKLHETLLLCLHLAWVFNGKQTASNSRSCFPRMKAVKVLTTSASAVLAAKGVGAALSTSSHTLAQLTRTMMKLFSNVKSCTSHRRSLIHQKEGHALPWIVLVHC